MPLQSQSQNLTPNMYEKPQTPIPQQQQPPQPSASLNISQMYQNLSHYQSMLKEIEQHNNKPIGGTSGQDGTSGGGATHQPF